MTDAPIKAIAPWFGSKRNLAPDIVWAIGDHRVYWEPFCGSLAVLMAKKPVPMETANDLHGHLINLARTLKNYDRAVELYGRAARLVFHEGLYLEAAERVRERAGGEFDPRGDVDAAEDFLVASWFGRNGVAGTVSTSSSFAVRYTASGGQPAKRWASVVDSIPAWHQRLRLVTILRRNAFEVLERIRDEEKTAIYLDPPYLVKGASYVHDFADADHVRLAELARRFTKAIVVVSYYDHPRLATLYPDWTIHRIEVTKSIANQGKRDEAGATKATEVLIVNRPPDLFFEGQDGPK